MAFVIAVGAFLVAYNTVVNLRPLPRWTYVPVNLAVAAILVGAARLQGETWQELGLGLSGLAAGIGWGLGPSVVVVAGMVGARWLARALPALRVLLRDRRAADLSTARLAYDTLVRIPLGTAFCEEVLFRGVLLAAMLDVGSLAQAVVASSALFGLWHIGPTLRALRENDAAARRTPVVLAAVVGTAVGGVGFALLRVGSGSLAAPVLVHWAINASGLLAAHAYQSAEAQHPQGP
ncbi:MAG: CPBP family intramembrane metalloprotease [Actinomycetota bacterium]|nr:CPBP family intramembrane metalloprotease [Actinomycetota bacterium]